MNEVMATDDSNFILVRRGVGAAAEKPEKLMIFAMFCPSCQTVWPIARPRQPIWLKFQEIDGHGYG